MPDLDLSLAPSAEAIRRKEFGTVRRGYDVDQVRDYLYAVAEQLESLERELNDAKMAAQNAPSTPAAPVAVPESDPYEAFAKKFAGLLGTADKEADRLVTEAKDESGRIVEEARADAERIRTEAESRAAEAKAEAERLLEQARAEAERALTGLAGRRQELFDQLQAMQARLLSAAQDLDVLLDEPEELPAPIAEAEAAASASAPPDAEGEPAEGESGTPAGELGVSREGVDLPDFDGIEFDFDADDHTPED